MKKNYQKGISLLEVLLSLTIIAVILVMAVRYFFIAENNNRINTTRQEIGSVIAAVNAWKGRHPQYMDNLNILTLYNSGDLTYSNSLVTDGGVPPNAGQANLYDPWGREITLRSSSAEASVTITANLPDQNSCISLQNSYPKAICDTDGKFELTIS